jgi:hypothetical protein
VQHFKYDVYNMNEFVNCECATDQVATEFASEGRAWAEQCDDALPSLSSLECQ